MNSSANDTSQPKAMSVRKGVSNTFNLAKLNNLIEPEYDQYTSFGKRATLLSPSRNTTTLKPISLNSP
jgi:hypothetical protein